MAAVAEKAAVAELPRLGGLKAQDRRSQWDREWVDRTGIRNSCRIARLLTPQIRRQARADLKMRSMGWVVLREPRAVLRASAEARDSRALAEARGSRVLAEPHQG